MVWLVPPFIVSSIFFMVEMTTQTGMPGGNFHRAFCFNSVKIIFLCSMSCLSDRTDSISRAVQKIPLFWIALWTDLSLLWNTEKAHLLSSPLECCDQTQAADCCYKYSVGNFSIYFSLIFLYLLNFFCAKECYKQANLENKIQHVIVIIDNFKGQR